ERPPQILDDLRLVWEDIVERLEPTGTRGLRVVVERRDLRQHILTSMLGEVAGAKIYSAVLAVQLERIAIEGTARSRERLPFDVPAGLHGVVDRRCTLALE